MHWLTNDGPLWLIYMIGSVLSILARADQSSMSKFTPWYNVKTFIVVHQNFVMVRFFINCCVFWIWWRTPEILSLLNIQKNWILPVNYATAGIFGVFSDRLLEYLMQKFHCTFGAVEEKKQ